MCVALLAVTDSVCLAAGSIRGRGAPRRSMPIFLSLSRANAQRLQDLPGGDEARVNFLATALGLQMVGRAGLTSPQKALVKVSLPPPVKQWLHGRVGRPLSVFWQTQLL